jgi:TPP-dependent indolepyruvate ferredoxin oxidoreductase alpha subunit
MNRRDFLKLSSSSLLFAGIASCDGLKDSCQGDECASFYPYFIDKATCTGCEVCVPLCGKKAISMSNKKRTLWVNQDLCIHCGKCYLTCEYDAVLQIETTGSETYHHNFYINTPNCINCMECYDICKAPAEEGGAGVSAILIDNDDSTAHIDQTLCSHCGECVELSFCPWGVINENTGR